MTINRDSLCATAPPPEIGSSAGVDWTLRLFRERYNVEGADSQHRVADKRIPPAVKPGSQFSRFRDPSRGSKNAVLRAVADGGEIGLGYKVATAWTGSANSGCAVCSTSGLHPMSTWRRFGAANHHRRLAVFTRPDRTQTLETQPHKRAARHPVAGWRARIFN